MTNLDSVLKSRDITLLTKVRLVKAMFFPQFPTADHGLRGPAPGVPARDLKGPNPIPAAGPCLVGSGLPGGPGWGLSPEVGVG